jgi:hypothetical protein
VTELPPWDKTAAWPSVTKFSYGCIIHGPRHKEGVLNYHDLLQLMRDDDGDCCFYRCTKDPIELLSLLTAHMNDQKVDEPDAKGETPLHLAAARGATICCLHLLQVG